MANCRIVAWGIVLLAPLFTAAQTTSKPTSPSVYGPTHRIHLPGNPHPEGLAVSPDGSTVFVSTTTPVVNVWQVLISFWPEIGGALVALVVLISLLRLRSIRRTPRLIGELHCRSCNYCLKNAASDRCAECGRSIDRAVIGRSVGARSAPYCVLLACVTLAYAGMMLAQVPRNGALSNTFEWWSSDLPDFALNFGVNVSGASRPVGRIWEIDVASGKVRRVLFTHSKPLDSQFGMSITPDGSHLIVNTMLPGGMMVVSTRTGSVERTIASPSAGGVSWLGWTKVAGYGPDGNSIYAVFADSGRNMTELYRTDVASGVCEKVLETGMDTVQYQKRSYPRAREIYTHVAGERILALEVESRQDPTGQCDFHLRDIGKPKSDAPLTRTAIFQSEHAPAFSLSGDRVFLHVAAGYYKLDASRFDTDTPRTLRLPRSFDSASYSSSADQPLGKLVAKLYMPTTVRTVFGGKPAEVYAVCDLEEERWTAVCATPNDGIYTRHAASRSGNAIVAAGFLKGKKNATQFQQELVIYDLRQPPKARGKENLASEAKY